MTIMAHGMVAGGRAAWQRPGMTDRSGPQAGGALLALAVIVGAIAGVATGQASIGVLAGTAAGIALALLVWLVDRRR